MSNQTTLLTISELRGMLKLSDNQLLDIAVAVEDGRKMDAIRLLRGYTGSHSDIGEAAKVIILIHKTLNNA